MGPYEYKGALMPDVWNTDGTLDNQHLNVLESAGDDPMGPYEYKGALMPDVQCHKLKMTKHTKKVAPSLRND